MKKKPKQSHLRKPQSTGGSAVKVPKGISDKSIALLLALLGFILYANTLGHGYVIDDDLAIALNENVRRGFGGIVDIFNQPYRQECFGGCLYRPLTLTTFAIEWAVSPNNPFVGHLMNVVWYAATAGLLFLAMRKFLPQFHVVIPLVAVILFTAHPVHTEVVANIKSRDEILSLFFVILSFYHYARWYETKAWLNISVAGLSFFAALLSKEGAISAFLIFPLIGWIFFNKSFVTSLKNSLWTVVPVLLFFLLRGAALSGLTEPDIHMMDNPMVNAEGTEFAGTSFDILLKYLLLLVLPLQLQSDYSYNVIPLQSLSSINSLAGLIIYVALVAYGIYGMYRRWVSGFITIAFLFSIVLYSHLLRVIGTMMAERLAYTPSLWFVLGLTAVLSVILKVETKTLTQFRFKDLKPGQRKLLLVCLGIALLYSFQTIRRNSDWVNNFTLYQADVVKAPNSVRLNDWYAEELYKSSLDSTLLENEIDNILKLTEKHSLKSLSIKPGVSAYNTLGNVSLKRRNFEQAVSYYQKALEIVENYNVAERNMMSALLMWARDESERNNNHSRARELLTRILQYDEDSSDVWHMIGITHGMQGNYEEALKALQKASSLAPDNERIKQDLNKTYLNIQVQKNQGK